MDRRYYEKFNADLNTLLDLIKSGGTTADLLDTLQSKIDALITVLTAERTQTDLFTRMLLNHALGNAGVAIATDTAKVASGNAIDFINQGLLKTKAATDDEFTLSGTALNAGADTAEKCRFLLTRQADGTPVATQGAIVAAASAAVLPAVPANETPIGYIEVETDASTTFTPGTTGLDTAGITDTYVDLAWPTEGTDALAALGAHGESAVGALTHPSTEIARLTS